jgi:hypothetical protein
MNNNITLVIFTCEEREYLLQKTIKSFRKNCTYNWAKVILAIDGNINPNIITEIAPDIRVQQMKRNGYVNSIATTLKLVKTPYFFWLEDDWEFHSTIDLEELSTQLNNHQNWGEIMLSKTGPLTAEEKINHLDGDFFHSIYGFSANPCLCNTKHIQSAFSDLELSPKGRNLGEDGFENFLTRKFNAENIKSVILDPINHQPISHEGYLETTSRGWHMTNSLEDNKSGQYLMTIPVPPFWRRLLMILKMFLTFLRLMYLQLHNNKIYEFCFRIVTLSKTMFKNKD